MYDVYLCMCVLCTELYIQRIPIQAEAHAYLQKAKLTHAHSNSKRFYVHTHTYICLRSMYW